jgi:hypothetical protein
MTPTKQTSLLEAFIQALKLEQLEQQLFQFQQTKLQLLLQ